MIIGITGGTGSGKSTLLALIGKQNAAVLDCEAIYHELLQTDKRLLLSIENAFPGTVTDGILDRKKLGAIVFHDEAALQELNSITHAAVKAEVRKRLSAKPNLAAIDAIGLFEGELNELCDVTVAVTAPTEDRVRRIMARDGISEEYARNRINAQHSDLWFSARCDYVLENDGTSEEFETKCIAFLRKIGII
jgi:dephospho-CoA kinase